MSRAYRIIVSETLRRHIRVSDGICTYIELLDILPKDGMCTILAAELVARGFRRIGECMVRTEEGGVDVSMGVVGDQAGIVTVRVVQDKQVDFEIERSRTVYEENAEQQQTALKREVNSVLALHERREHDTLAKAVTEKLQQRLRDLGRELDQISNIVTAKALKVRASQIGEIRKISEDPETGSLTITVKV